ncbi:MAG TPA: DUF1028 domain-containing protein [Alphaproteobacteria bacterium]|jgi:uncharacterized Ntn-hydrolase superfamily protein
MTWSIVARDSATGAFGVAVATKFFAVGALCPHASAAGALATQALINPTFGPRGLRLLAEGIGAPHVVAALVESDEGRDSRQLHAMDRNGLMAAYTGKGCIDWCGHKIAADHSVAGNMLAGARVIEDTSAAYAANARLPFPRRLIAALKAGEAAGGDKRGKQSAALIIAGEEEWPLLDLRVDDHADPLAELERLERVSRERFVHFRQFLPTRANPAGIYDRAKIEAGIAAALAADAAAQDAEG